MSNDAYMKKVLGEVGVVLKQYDPVTIVDTIAKNHNDLQTLSVVEQNLLGAVLGSMLHEAYCNGRRLDQPTADGLLNNPREKVLTEDLDHILNSARAVRMKAALENHKFIEPLCFTCGFKRK